MTNLIQGIINEPTASIGILILLFIIFLIGYLTAWCFKGGIIRFLCGLFLITDAFFTLLDGDSMMAKTAFWGGFIFRFFDGWQGIIRRKDNLLWRVEIFWNGAVCRFLRRLFAKKPKQKQNTSNTQSEYQKTGNSQQEDIEKERVRRAEEMHRQREAEKAHKQAEKDQQEKADNRKSEKSEDKKSKKSEKKKAENNQQNQEAESQKRDDFEEDFNARIQKMIRSGYLATLGLAPDGEYTQAEIKKAYRRQANKYHPDRHMGKSEAEIKAMNEKFAEIKRGYEWLTKDH